MAAFLLSVGCRDRVLTRRCFGIMATEISRMMAIRAVPYRRARKPPPLCQLVQLITFPIKKHAHVGRVLNRCRLAVARPQRYS